MHILRLHGFSHKLCSCLGQLVLLLLPFLSYASTLTEGDVKCICREIAIEAQLNPDWVKGTEELERGGLGDCSGKIFAIFRRCGVPVLRTTARRMILENASGWDGIYVQFEKARATTLVGMTCENKRPLGHIGILARDVQFGLGELFHMSSSRGGMLVTIDKSKQNYFYKVSKKYKDLRK